MMYQVKKSQSVIDNKEFFLADCKRCEDHLKTFLTDTTWEYKKYNIFSLVMPSNNWHSLYVEICDTVRKFTGYKKQLYIRAWLNCHKENEVLDWHIHSDDFHGFVAFDDYPTTTVFEDFEVKTETGNIYVGFGSNPHMVRADKNFEQTRYTLAFDVVTGRHDLARSHDEEIRQTVLTDNQFYPLL